MAMHTEPVLRHPNFKRCFRIYTDASAYGLGAVSTQVDEKGNEYVVEYASRLLKGAELPKKNV